MPRPVNTSQLQAAFSQLGNANAIQANRQLQQRELDRQERASIGALLGTGAGLSLTGGSPIGAQVGGLIGTKLAGGRTTPGQVTATGVAIGQAMQPTAAEQQQQASQEIQAARAGQEQQRINFDQTFQPVQVTPEQMAIAEGQPQPFVADPNRELMRAQLLGVQEQPTGILGLQAQPEAVAPTPTQDQVQRASQFNELSQLAAEATRPKQVGGGQLPTKGKGVLQDFINQQENQLNQERQLLETGNLSPNAFALQKARVDRMLAGLEDIKQKALFSSTGGQAKDPKLYRVERDGKDIFVGTANQLMSQERLPSDKVYQVGKEGQSLKGFGRQADINKDIISELNPRELLSESNKIAAEAGSYIDRNIANAYRRQAELKAEKNIEGVKKEISNLDRGNYSLGKVREIKSSIDSLENNGLVTPKVAEKYREKIIDREKEVIRVKKQRSIPIKERKEFAKTIEMKKVLTEISNYRNLFSDFAFERQGRRVIAKLKQGTGSTVNDEQKINSLIAKGQLLLTSGLVKGAASDKDQDRINNAFVQLGNAPDTALSILNSFKENIKTEAELVYDGWTQEKDITPVIKKYYDDLISDNLRDINKEESRQTQDNPIPLSRKTIGNISAGQKVRLPNGKIVVATQGAINKFKQQNKIK